MTGVPGRRPAAVPGPLVVVSDRAASERAGRSLTETVAAAVAAGAPAVLLREKDLHPAERHRLAVQLADVTARSGARLGIASDLALAANLELDWVHLAAHEPVPPKGRVGRPAVVGRSCHGPGDLAAAALDDADYASLSPVLLTASKPGYGPALGFDGFAALASAAGLPVTALGGLGAEAGTVAAACRAGAAAVWVMGAVMGAADPGAVVRSLLAELAELAPPRWPPTPPGPAAGSRS